MIFWEYAPGLFLNLYQVTHIQDAHQGEGVVEVVFTSGIPRLLTPAKSAELRRILGSAIMRSPFTEAHTR